MRKEKVPPDRIGGANGFLAQGSGKEIRSILRKERTEKTSRRWGKEI